MLALGEFLKLACANAFSQSPPLGNAKPDNIAWRL
jgi:hypothetical protein